MEIDHFNPKITGRARNSYSNLYLTVAHCNGKKSDYWPTAKEIRQGIRFLDPCSEIDYGEQIFENPETFELVGTTPAACYHIDICDLNNDTFLHERRMRALIRSKAEGVLLSMDSDKPWRQLEELLAVTIENVATMIPDIPAPPERGPH